MNIHPRVSAPLCAAAASLLLLLAGCGHKEPSAYENTADHATPGLFTVPADQMQHIQLYTVAPTEMKRVLRLTGAVAYNAFATTPVISSVGGPVARIVVAPGEHIKQHQPMLYVSSPDFAQLRATYLKARDAFALADKNYARAQDLYAHHAVAEADLLGAESARTQAQADLQNTEQSLHVLGVTNPDSVLKSSAVPELPLLAPIGGEVVDQEAAPGLLLQAGQTQCFTISDMSTVWVLVNVYQQDLPYVHAGDPVTIQTDAYQQSFDGKISYISAALDPTSRTLQARIVTHNPGEQLKKDMYVTASVVAGTIKNALTVPDAALLRNAENQPYVYISMGDGKFAERDVKTATASEGKTQVVVGLKPGDKVVAEGALFLQFANSLQQ
ncbi:MAG TPA: efflux RND transporter periplasmic adaptor subunit [Terriglobales bacterium]|nr:efflux RND transporter periplasmic adaptor subunit [Terriglobales bacterium]